MIKDVNLYSFRLFSSNCIKFSDVPALWPLCDCGLALSLLAARVHSWKGDFHHQQQNRQNQDHFKQISTLSSFPFYIFDLFRLRWQWRRCSHWPQCLGQSDKTRQGCPPLISIMIQNFFSTSLVFELFAPKKALIFTWWMTQVSYVSALDIWMCTCIIFVFFTLLEYVVVLW